MPSSAAGLMATVKSEAGEALVCLGSANAMSDHNNGASR
jgi:hypothetical protein